MALANPEPARHPRCMSKSLKRVRAALESAGVTPNILETAQARTAADAANAIGCEIDQIAKSIIFAGQNSGEAILFITAGGNRVDADKAAQLAGEPLGKADAAMIRAQTGFAIGGVSPVGHVNPVRAFLDPKLHEFDVIWAAAGTPHHVFSSTAQEICKISGCQGADFTQ
jgi:prolyl-tRNA editing enzyme YbaK/EbsC (Cys-tRNA(Pro) deacylase)